MAKKKPKSSGESDQSKPMMTVSEVADMLTCSTRHVFRMADEGAMPAPVHLGSLVRWSRTQLETWINDGCPSVKRRRSRE